MSFVHPLLLGGLLLIGIPVLIHFISRHKPKRLVFPAFRFLEQKHRSNTRRLRLRHLLLLLLRMAVLAILCLALARPRLFSERLNLATDRPVAAVLVFDTTPSMEYQVKEESRLEAARRRGLELLNELPAGSRIAVLDGSDAGGEWGSVDQARDRVRALKVRHSAGPVTRQLGPARRLFDELGQEPEDEGRQRFLYVFSDRTATGWESGEARGLKLPDDVHAAYFDLGADSPADVAIESIELARPVVHPGDRAEVRITVRATGNDCDSEVILRVDREAGERRPVKLRAGQSEVLVFSRPTATGPDTPGLAVGLHQVEVQLASADALPFNNRAFATLRVQEGRRVLVLADRLQDAGRWTDALFASRRFPCDVKTTAEAARLTEDDLSKYRAVCLLSVANPPAELWKSLADYVERKGGGLAVIPGGEGWRPIPKAWEGEAALKLLPGKLAGVVSGGEAGTLLKEIGPDPPPADAHPFLAPFRQWRKVENVDFFTPEYYPRAFRYWDVKPDEKTQVILHYKDKDNRPALLERTVGAGRVLLFTTAFDNSERWNTYYELNSFGVVLELVAVGYLAGDAEAANFNGVCGQPMRVALPADVKDQVFTLTGPGIEGADAKLTRERGQTQLPVPRAVLPGQYQVRDLRNNVVAAFSLNVRPEESLLERAPAEQVEAALGPGSVLEVGHDTRLGDLLEDHWRQPYDLYWLVMALLVLALTAEGLLANLFYRRPAQEQETQQPLAA